MLAIRMQRTGRKGHAMFRLVAQDSRRTPTSGKVAAYLGTYDPHTKAAVLNKDRVAFYLEHGAQPSERVVFLLKKEGVKLPAWVMAAKKQDRKVRNPEKLRRNRPASEEAAPAQPEAEAEPTTKEVSPEPSDTGEEKNESSAEAEAEPAETSELPPPAS